MTDQSKIRNFSIIAHIDLFRSQSEQPVLIGGVAEFIRALPFRHIDVQVALGVKTGRMGVDTVIAEAEHMAERLVILSGVEERRELIVHIACIAGGVLCRQTNELVRNVGNVLSAGRVDEESALVGIARVGIHIGHTARREPLRAGRRVGDLRRAVVLDESEIRADIENHRHN